MNIRTDLTYKKGYKYQLYDQYRITTPLRPIHTINTRYIELTTGGVMTIKCGYAWDGASGPTLDTKSTMHGSLFHDASYQLIRQDMLGHENRKLSMSTSRN